MMSVRVLGQLAKTGVEQPTTTPVASAHSSAGSRPWACAPLSLSPLTVSSLRTRPHAELLLLVVSRVEGGQAPHNRTYVEPWRPPSRHGHGGLLEAEARRGVAGPWRRRRRGEQRRAQAFDGEEMRARDRAFCREGWG
jgi:hypothetical protein